MELARKWSPILVLGLVFAVSYTMGTSLGISLVLAIAGAIIAGIIFIGRIYKPFYVGKEGQCQAQGNQKERCRHYYATGGRFGGCGRREETGKCRLRRS